MGIFDKFTGSIKERHERRAEFARFRGDVELSVRTADGFVLMFPTETLPYDLLYLVEAEHADAITDDLTDGELDVVDSVDVVPLENGYVELTAYLTDEGRGFLQTKDDDYFAHENETKLAPFCEAAETQLRAFVDDVLAEDGVALVSTTGPNGEPIDGDLLVGILGDYGTIDIIEQLDDHPMVFHHEEWVLEDEQVIDVELLLRPVYHAVFDDVKGLLRKANDELLPEYLARISD